MNKKTSADYQREFRRRLRDQGLVKKEVWILPENAKHLAAVEQQLRKAGHSSWINLGDVNMNKEIAMKGPWTTETLYEALKQEVLFAGGGASIELIEGAEPSLYIEMKGFGDLPVFMTVAGEQILAESVLWPKSAVINVTAFNDAILRTHKYFPLSTISLDAMEDGEDYYHMFGALSSSSIISNIVFEIEALSTNVIQATEAYNEFLLAAPDLQATI